MSVSYFIDFGNDSIYEWRLFRCMDDYVKKRTRSGLTSTPILIKSKMVYNGGFSNFELPLLDRNFTYVAQILCGLSYKV